MQPDRPASDSPAAAEILAQERKSLEHWSSGDAAGYANSAAPDVTYFDDIGASERIDGLEAWRTYLGALEIPPHDYELIDPKVQVYGDAAVLTMRYNGLGPDGAVVSRWKATSVYRHVDGEWRTVHAHWSLVKDE